MRRKLDTKSLPGSGERLLVLHYHLFKNAGTSIDRGLKRSFGEHWASIESGPGRGILPLEELQLLIDENLKLRAISSHTAEIRPWAIERARIFPIVFLRHPIDRIRSAYDFERKQRAQTLGAQKAKQLAFKDYVVFFMGHARSNAFRNFQSKRLAASSGLSTNDFLTRAMDVVARLPCVGLVECFNESVTRFESLCEQLDLALQIPRARANIGPRIGNLSDRVTAIRSELGENLFERAMFENQDDFKLWDYVRKRFALEMPANVPNWL